ncbi:MAG: hypothetical protein L0219_22715 [Phycisphaerales bacterium]|nr:hypothetical protein [Phycisphaerales bacterium]
MYTEDEAKAKWCPFVRVSVVSDPVALTYAHNRDDAQMMSSGFNCIASQCMAWREHAVMRQVKDAHGTITGISTGFCGLAGKP